MTNFMYLKGVESYYIIFENVKINNFTCENNFIFRSDGLNMFFIEGEDIYIINLMVTNSINI